MMKRFESDYLEGAHPDVLRALIETNGEQTPGYGEDPHCEAARALLRDPRVLILDEATSALDSLTEAKIQHAFDELAKDRTTLIIAHRLSTIRQASRILVIADGCIEEQGTHEELLAKGGTYAGLYHTQNAEALHAS